MQTVMRARSCSAACFLLVLFVLAARASGTALHERDAPGTHLSTAAARRLLQGA
jgi:hypothetical protein